MPTWCGIPVAQFARTGARNALAAAQFMRTAQSLRGVCAELARSLRNVRNVAQSFRWAHRDVIVAVRS